jgi:hypothetical protein
MVIAHFNLIRAIGFLILVTAVMAAFGGVAYSSFRDGGWSDSLPTVVMLAGMFFSICAVLIACWDRRAIWIESGVLRFYEMSYDHEGLLVFRRKVPIESIAGLSSGVAKSSGAVERHGIYVDLKSGGSYRVMTFLLTEPREVVMARLREQLGFTETKADVS